MKRLVFATIFISVNTIAIAQHIADEDSLWRADSAAVHQKIDSIFINLDKTKMPTGFLFERVISNFSGMENYSGHTDSIINETQWLQMYFELKHFAEFSPSALPSINDVINSGKAQNETGKIPVGFINMNINRIKPFALDSGLLYMQNEQLFENSNNTQSPYDSMRVFAVFPLGPIEAQKGAEFRIDSSFYFSNTSEYPNIIEIDFDDGFGFRTLTFGDAINITYPDTGSIIITTRVIYTADTLYSRTAVVIGGIIPLQANIAAAAAEPCCDDFDAGVYFPPDEIIYLNGGRAYIKYGGGNSDKKMRKPFIFVEGIDFNSYKQEQEVGDPDIGTRHGDLGWKQIILAKEFYKEELWNPFSATKERNDANIAKVPALMKKLCSEGNDLIMLDFEDGATWINDNAMVLVELIQKVNQRLQNNGSSHQIAVMGVSMGGQVARYALRYMEINESSTGPHNTRLFISFDSPNRGANISLGTQYAMRYASLAVFTDAAAGALFRPATKQLLIYHYAKSKQWQNEAHPYPEHINLYNSTYMATFPQKPRMVAIANGSGVGANQGYGPGAKTIDVFSGRLFRVWAVENQKNNPETIFFGQTTALISLCAIPALCPIVIIISVITSDLVRMKNTLPLDNTSGGWRDTHDYFAQSLPASGVLNLHAEFGRHNHSFIPTYSAMGISLSNIPNSDITLPMSAASILNGSAFPRYKTQYGSISPFDAIYAPQNNQKHVNITDENIGWIMNEVSPENLFLQNKTIANPAIFEARTTITAGRNVTNSVPQGDFVVQNNSGEVKIRSGELITLKPGTRLKPTGSGSVRVYIEPLPCQAVQRMANNSSPEKGKSVYKEIKSKKEVPLEFKEEIKKAKSNKLLLNYPNPCTDHTHIDYLIEENSKIEIALYNLMGQKMQTIEENQNKEPGHYSTILNTSELSQGIYIVLIKSNGVSAGVLKIQVTK
jgi:pimeloyl-ACP methyl ester carboxylesterase